jgi:two-component system response regulator FixJ
VVSAPQSYQCVNWRTFRAKLGCRAIINGRRSDGLAIVTPLKLQDSDTAVLSGSEAIALPDVLLVDDDPAILGTLIEGLAERGIKAIGAATSVDALMQLSDIEPSCVVLDLKMPDVEGLDLLAAFCAAKRHVIIILSAYVDVGTTVDAMRLGAFDVLEKPVSMDRLEAAIHEALKHLETQAQADDLTFTRRERQVAELIVQGQTAKQIAQHLGLSHRTIEFFRSNLMRKTHSPNSAALASALTRIGFS